MKSVIADASYWRLFVPKIVTVLRDGYDLQKFRLDFISGLTVAIVALPLSIALAIASGAKPEQGLYTAAIAGFLISCLGGSRFQIGGPTGAFVVVVYDVIHTHGYEGLVLATMMAGILLIAAGFAKVGTIIKYVPHPVITGFTTGIAAIIFTSQVATVLGLSLQHNSIGFVEQWAGYLESLHTAQASAIFVASVSLASILACRIWRPEWPALLVAVVVGVFAHGLVGAPVETIQSKFGELPNTLPWPTFPEVTITKVRDLLPSAFTIAFLAGVESLLSAVVADGMTGRRHRSNCELVAQGIANVCSVTVGGIPATGAIARTATNIRAGAHSPISGVLHAIFILLFMMLLAPLANEIPLASLGAILIVVAWNMSEVKSFRHLLRAPPADRAVLIATFTLTLFADITVAIGIGVVLAALFFMHRMANAVEIGSNKSLIDEDEDDYTRVREQYHGPKTRTRDVEIFQINGPFFFGAAARLGDVIDRLRTPPRFFILRMGNVPLIDASGAAALEKFIHDAELRGTRTILSNVQPDVRAVLDDLSISQLPNVTIVKNLAKALALSGASETN